MNTSWVAAPVDSEKELEVAPVSPLEEASGCSRSRPCR